MTIEAAQPTELQLEIDLDALIRDLDAGMHSLPEAALRTCQRHRELVTPRLIEVLQEAVRLGRGGEVRAGNAHFFALFLLTEFEAKEALPAILDLFSLREPVLEGLIGGAVTETTRRVLAVLAGDQPDLIESLIPSPHLDDYIRWEAAAALCQLVRDERLSRAEALERLMRQLRSAVAAGDSWAATIVVCEMGHLNPLEVQDEIKAAFDQNLVDESIIDWSCIEKYDLHPDQPGTCPGLLKWNPGMIADTVQELRTWHWFSEESRQEREATRQSEADQGEVDSSDKLLALDAFGPLVPFEPEPVFGTARREGPRVGRNDPCPCGSGKKFKKCCLRPGNHH